jgi:hypothetical protein
MADALDFQQAPIDLAAQGIWVGPIFDSLIDPKSLGPWKILEELATGDRTIGDLDEAEFHLPAGR